MPPAVLGARTWNEKLTQRLGYDCACSSRWRNLAYSASGPERRTDAMVSSMARSLLCASCVLRPCCSRSAISLRCTATSRQSGITTSPTPPTPTRRPQIIIGSDVPCLRMDLDPGLSAIEHSTQDSRGAPRPGRGDHSQEFWRHHGGADGKKGSVGSGVIRLCALRVVIVLQALQKSEMAARNGVGKRLAVCHAQCLADLPASFRV